ncbi:MULTISPECIES: VacJ family lipoprotein [unclassified Sphingomonas]|uniref:MlaA family lipoprotein n=1 Tax=unclassified Sphingomonas TaxID=196159 RepID=UPI0025D933E7|nr:MULTISPECIES: VacJ family lipoprotein [unclassified Sphingomonas]
MSFPVILFATLLPSSMQPTAAAFPEAETRDAISRTMTPSLPAPYIQASPGPPPAEPPPAIEAPPASRRGSADNKASEDGTQAAPEDIIVEAHRRNDAGDPLHALNEKSFEATQAVDKAVIAPMAFAYKRHVPRPVRDGVRNILKNLREPIVLVNFLLQLKPGKAAETAGRFALNSTAGIGGLLDIAKRRPFNLPRRPNGFADTLGFYGVKPGPFFFLPLIGPTTLRDAIGGVADRALLLTAIGAPFNRPAYSVPATVLGTLDRRIEFDEDLRRIRDETENPYVSRRTFYLRKRQAEIDALKGHQAKNRVTQNPSASSEQTSLSSRPPLRCDVIPTLDAAPTSRPTNTQP